MGQLETDIEQLSLLPESDDPNEKASPFVKWAGGKRSVLKDISKHLPSDIRTYHEPFVGGGAVFFAFEHIINKATLADLNEELVMAYHVIANDTDNLIEALLKHQENHHKKESYYISVRKQNPAKLPLIDVVARFVYLNKTCFNGLYRVNKSGKFNVPKGNYKNPKICDTDNLKKVAKVLEKATILVGEFDRTVSPQRGDFVYCDPPYDGTFTKYQADGFEQADQKRLKQCIDKWVKNGVSVMVSNSNTKFIRNLYKDYHVHTVTAQRNISCNEEQRGSISEVLITNYE